MTDRIEEIKQARARQEYAAIRGFYIHVLIYGAVIVGLTVINFMSGSRIWVHWPAIGWGIGVLAHGYLAFVSKPRQLAAWEAEQIGRIKAGPSA